MYRRASYILAFVTAVVHMFLGGSDTLSPMIASDLPDYVRTTFEAVWHFITLFLLVSAYVFWKGGETRPLVAVLWLIFAFVFFMVVLWRMGPFGLITLPHWLFIGLAGGAGLLAALRAAQTRPNV